MMPSKHTNLWSLFITLGLVCFVYYFYTTVLRPTVAYPSHVNKTLYIDDSFSAEEILFISKAAEEWHQSTNGIVTYKLKIFTTDDSFYHIDYANSIIVMKVNHNYPEVIELDIDLEQVTLGYCNSHRLISYIALVTDRLEDHTYQLVILHELGHSLGLNHNEGVSGEGTLMYPSVEKGAAYITSKDLNNFCKLYHCNSNELHDQQELFHF